MSTPNFANRNTSKVFAIGLTQFDEEEEPIYPDMLNIEGIYEDVNLAMQSKFNYNNEVDVYFLNEYDKYSNRSYPAHNICQVSAEKEFGDMWVGITFVVKAVSGYYEGACLDYDIVITTEYDDAEIDYVDQLIEDMAEDSEMNAGLKTIQKKNILNWIENTIPKMTVSIEEVFKDVSEAVMIKTAQFSNGEAIYQKV